MKVEFSDQAIHDLRQLYPQENKFVQVRLFIKSKLAHSEAELIATPVEAFSGKDMYDYPVDGNVVLYQLVDDPRHVLVWAVHEASSEIIEPEDDD